MRENCIELATRTAITIHYNNALKTWDQLTQALLKCWRNQLRAQMMQRIDAKQLHIPAMAGSNRDRLTR
jgi:hypothetical protein